MKDKTGHYIIIKGSIYQHLTILHAHTVNNSAPKYIKYRKQKLPELKEIRATPKTTAGSFSFVISAWDTVSRDPRD